MNYKKIIALGLAAAMILSTAGMTTFAEEAILIDAAEDSGDFCEESDSYAGEDSLDDSEDLLTADEDMIPDFTEEDAGCFLEDDEEILEADGIESADEEQAPWLTLFTTEKGAGRQVIIFHLSDGSWTDGQGNFFTKQDDGTWTGTNGLVYYESPEDCSGDEGGSLIEESDYDGKKDDGSGKKAAGTVIKESKKITQNLINSMIDCISRQNAELIPVMNLMKLLIGDMMNMDGSTDPNAAVLKRIDEIDRHLNRMEEDLKSHLENVVAFDSIGGQFQALTDDIPALSDKIGDYMEWYEDGEIDEDTLTELLAGLYNSAEYTAVKTSLAGATHAYAAKTCFTLDERSIFGAAYKLQCGKVMFSGEAVDCVTPYLLRQLCTYLEGYALINTVLDAYETVHGTSATKKTRETMFKDLGGIVNGTFDESNPGVFGLYNEFFSTYRYTFVNKSSDTANHVRLSSDILAIFSFSTHCLGSKGPVFDSRKYTPDGLKNFPLDSEQMKALAKYASSRHTTLYSLLFDTVGFRLKIIPTLSMQVMGIMQGTSVNADTIITVPEISGLHVSAKNITLGEYLRICQTYMPTGRQCIKHTQETSFAYGAPEYNHIQGINANQIGAEDERLILKHNFTYSVDPNMLLFMAG